MLSSVIILWIILNDAVAYDHQSTSVVLSIIMHHQHVDAFLLSIIWDCGEYLENLQVGKGEIERKMYRRVLEGVRDGGDNEK